MFSLGDDIALTNIINSQSFEDSDQQTIYSMDMSESNLFVTLGNKGLGIIDLKKETAKGKLINLTKDQTISKYLLDDSEFLRVTIVSSTTSKLEILVTTSTSLNYILSMKLSTLTFSVNEIYNRYGHERILNWAQVTEKNVFLSFYNSTTDRQDILIYPRSTKGLVEFYGSKKLGSSNGATIPTSGLLNSGKTDLFMFLGSTDGLNQLNVTDSYGLLLDYDRAGHFSKVDLMASNAYVEKENVLKIAFE